MRNKFLESDQMFSCCFCLKTHSEVKKLVGGSSKRTGCVFICNECASACVNQIIGSESVKASAEVVSCDFCDRTLGEIRHNADVLLTRNSFSICGQCLGLVLQINLSALQPDKESAILF